jgi:signal peptidase II
VTWSLKRHHHLMIWPALVVCLLDQASKWLVTRALGVHDSLTVISGFFNLVHVTNRGMAFGLLNRPGFDLGFYFLVSATLVAILLLVAWCLRLKDTKQRLIPGLSLILGGAVGNLIDRLRYREVIDFLDFYVGSYHWPAFNVADSAITIGAFWVVIVLCFQRSSRHVP